MLCSFFTRAESTSYVFVLEDIVQSVLGGSYITDIFPKTVLHLGLPLTCHIFLKDFSEIAWATIYNCERLLNSIYYYLIVKMPFLVHPHIKQARCRITDM